MANDSNWAVTHFDTSVNATAELAAGHPVVLYMGEIDNEDGAAEAFLQLFDAKAVADVMVGTTAPKIFLAVPAGGNRDWNWTKGIKFDKGIVYALTTDVDNNTAPSSAGNIWLGFR